VQLCINTTVTRVRGQAIKRLVDHPSRSQKEIFALFYFPVLPPSATFCFSKPTHGVHALRVYPANHLPTPHCGPPCFSQSGTFRPPVQGPAHHSFEPAVGGCICDRHPSCLRCVSGYTVRVKYYGRRDLFIGSRVGSIDHRNLPVDIIFVLVGKDWIGEWLSYD
jgi:hypothetical protein